MATTILAGFSINLEVSFVFDGDSSEAKIPLQDATLRLAGSALNTVTALSSLGVSPALIGLVDADPDPFGVIMKGLFGSVSCQHHLLPVLDRSGLAFLPIGGKVKRVIGRRGQVKECFLNQAIAEVSRIRGEIGANICLALGVTDGESELTKALFQDEASLRVLVPSKSLFFSSLPIEEILGLTDFLFMSDYEYEASGLSVSQIHSFGVDLLVVTENSRGGWFSYHGTQMRYPAVSSNCVSEVGAGDWFLAAFLVKLTENQEVLDYFSIEQIESSLKFASLVAGMKVEHVGASTGPTLEDIARRLHD